MRGIVLGGVATVAMAVVGCGSSSTSPTVHVDGVTAAWFQGNTVQLSYTKNYECDNPPAAASVSHCEVGDSAVTVPANDGPPLWVIVPLFTTPIDSTTLQCPHRGNCVDHPADLDLSTYLSAVFGPSAGQTPLPPHSHIIDDEDGHANVPWAVKVVGVLDTATWSAIVAGKSLATVRTIQSTDPGLLVPGTAVGTHITVDIPSNLYLFFEAN